MIQKHFDDIRLTRPRQSAQGECTFQQVDYFVGERQCESERSRVVLKAIIFPRRARAGCSRRTDWRQCHRSNARECGVWWTTAPCARLVLERSREGRCEERSVFADVDRLDRAYPMSESVGKSVGEEKAQNAAHAE